MLEAELVKYYIDGSQQQLDVAVAVSETLIKGWVPRRLGSVIRCVVQPSKVERENKKRMKGASAN